MESWFVTKALAHEIYVLSPGQVESGLSSPRVNVFDALSKAENLQIAVLVASGIIMVLAFNLLFQRSQLGKKLDQRIQKLNNFAPVLIRLALAGSLIYGAVDNAFLGPEIPLTLSPILPFLKPLLLVLGLLFLFNQLVSVAALVGILLFIYFSYLKGWYLLTYLNYLGEFIALVVFTSKKGSEAEPLLIRVFYGAALIFAAVNIKFLHPSLTMAVFNQYHLAQFSWLFPKDPLLTTLGAGILELLIGLFIIVGFSTRLTVLITLFYFTLSLLFFKEAVWPHFLLYGLSLYLLINNSGKYSLDNWLAKVKGH